jgi:hypothetical protein
MMREIEVQLPPHLDGKWEIVAVRKAEPGEFFLYAAGTLLEATETCNDFAPILRKIDPLAAIKAWWPEWLGFDWITVEIGGLRRGWFGAEPTWEPVEQLWMGTQGADSVHGLRCVGPPQLPCSDGRCYPNPWKTTKGGAE